jgi:hypothetical protein
MIHEIDQIIDGLLTVNGGEITAEIEAMMLDLKDKKRWLENAVKRLINERAQLEGIKAEARRVRELQSERERTIEGLESTIRKLLGEGNKSDLGFAKLSWRRSEALQVADGAEDKLPDRFIIASFSVDKKAVKEAIKAGEELWGCELVEKNNLQVK